jgi:hypothetical protein
MEAIDIDVGLGFSLEVSYLWKLSASTWDLVKIPFV